MPAAGEGEALPAWVGFKGQNNPAWTRKDTEVWPVQKFEWKDLTLDFAFDFSSLRSGSICSLSSPCWSAVWSR